MGRGGCKWWRRWREAEEAVEMDVVYIKIFVQTFRRRD